LCAFTNCTKQTGTLQGSIIKYFQSSNIISSVLRKHQEHLYSSTYSSKSNARILKPSNFTRLPKQAFRTTIIVQHKTTRPKSKFLTGNQITETCLWAMAYSHDPPQCRMNCKQQIDQTKLVPPNHPQSMRQNWLCKITHNFHAKRCAQFGIYWGKV
jgi:hypothetical protein